MCVLKAQPTSFKNRPYFLSKIEKSKSPTVTALEISFYVHADTNQAASTILPKLHSSPRNTRCTKYVFFESNLKNTFFEREKITNLKIDLEKKSVGNMFGDM